MTPSEMLRNGDLPQSVALTAEAARGLIRYDSATGQFFWIDSRCHTTKDGELAGCLDRSNGYWVIRILAKKHFAHRLAFLLMNGEWPSCCVDHINGDRADNRWVNLREATRSQNLMNTKIRSDNKTGHRGVTWCNTYKRYKAIVTANGATYHIGSFTRIEDAIEGASAVRKELFGEFERNCDGRQ